jgi:hypothetical protein
MKSTPPLPWLVAAGCLLLGGCNFEVPITAGPTRPIEPQLLGDWVAVDKDNPKPDQMKVRQLDEFNYVITYNGDLYRAYHSDFASLPFVSVQDLESSGRKFAYFKWQVSADGAQLTLQTVGTRVIPDTTPDSVTIQQLLTKNLANPELLDAPVQFTRKKPAKT